MAVSEVAILHVALRCVLLQWLVVTIWQLSLDILLLEDRVDLRIAVTPQMRLLSALHIALPRTSQPVSPSGNVSLTCSTKFSSLTFASAPAWPKARK